MASTVGEPPLAAEGSVTDHNPFGRPEIDSSFWDRYTKARPCYSESYWKRLFAYHDRHDHSQARYGVAHDIACGPGHNVAHLDRFVHVVASDISRSATRAAADALAASRTNQISLLQMAAERLADAGVIAVARSLVGGVPFSKSLKATADLVHLSEAIPLMNDPSTVLTSCAGLLKPGGTMCISLYGRMRFASSAAGQRCQMALDATLQAMTQWCLEHEPMQPGMTQSVGATMDARLSDIALPESLWQDVERHHWLDKQPIALVPPPRLPRPSSVAAGGNVILHADQEAPMRMKVDSETMQLYLGTHVAAGLERLQDEAEDVRRCVQELGEAMGKETWDVRFPSTMLLARRR